MKNKNEDEIRRLTAEIQRYSMILHIMYSLDADSLEIRMLTEQMLEKTAELNRVIKDNTENT